MTVSPACFLSAFRCVFTALASCCLCLPFADGSRRDRSQFLLATSQLAIAFK